MVGLKALSLREQSSEGGIPMPTLEMNFNDITSGPNNTIDLPLPDTNSGENIYFRTFVDGLIASEEVHISQYHNPPFVMVASVGRDALPHPAIR